MTNQIIPTKRAEYWMMHDGTGNVTHTGIVQIGQRVTSGQPAMIHSADENTYLAGVNNSGQVGGLPPMPVTGEHCEEKITYNYNGKSYICRQSHDRTSHNPEDVPSLWSSYRADSEGEEWVPNEQVAVGNIRLDNSTKYECIQAHQTQSGWSPRATPALWALVPPETGGGEWAVGVAYAVDDEVVYLGIDYKCLQAHTSQDGWHPVAVPALWIVS